MAVLSLKRNKIKMQADDVARRNPMHKKHLIILFVFFCVYAFFIIFPYLWVIVSSLKTKTDFYNNPIGLPSSFVWSNYLEIFKLEDYSLPVMFKNTLILCFVCPTLSCLSSTLAGYVMAKYNFKGRKFIYALYILPMLISLCGTSMSTYKLICSDDGLINLKGSFFSLFILACNGTGMNFLLIYSLFASVSDTYMEAAEIDGAGYYAIFVNVMLPHAMGLIGTLWIMSFIGQWNDYAGAYIFLGYQPEYATIATGIQKLTEKVEKSGGELNGNYPVLYASIVLTVIPMVILFLCFQKQIMKLSLGGGIKE